MSRSRKGRRRSLATSPKLRACRHRVSTPSQSFRLLSESRSVRRWSTRECNLSRLSLGARQNERRLPSSLRRKGHPPQRGRLRSHLEGGSELPPTTSLRLNLSRIS